MRIGRSFHSCKQLFPPDHYVLPHCSENLPGQPVAVACCTCSLLSSGAGCQPELPSLKQAGRGLHSHTHYSESGRQLALEPHGAPIINMFRLFEKRSQQLTQSLPIIFCTIIRAKGMATAKRGENTSASLELKTVTERKKRATRLPTTPAYLLTAKSLRGRDLHQGVSNSGDPHRICTKPVFSARLPSVWGGS